MKVSEFQAWVRDEFGDPINRIPAEHQLAFLLEQSGQLAQAVIHADRAGMEKEIAEVILAVVGVANKHGIDVAESLKSHLTSKTAGEILKNINL